MFFSGFNEFISMVVLLLSIIKFKMVLIVFFIILENVFFCVIRLISVINFISIEGIFKILIIKFSVLRINIFILLVIIIV